MICIIEAMKLMNEIESDASGEVVKCLFPMASLSSMGSLFSLSAALASEAEFAESVRLAS